MDKTTDIQDLKIEIIHWLTDISDKDVLDKILAIKAKNKSLGLTAAQEAELELRLSQYDKGETKFKSWDKVKANIRKRSRHVA